MAKCLVKKIKGVIDNSILSTLDAITLYVDTAVKETLTVLSKGGGMTVSCTEGNYLSLSSDGSNPTNNISITTYVQTAVYLLPGKYNVLCKNITNLDVFYYDGAQNNSKLLLSDVFNSIKLTSLRIQYTTVEGDIDIFKNFNYIVSLNFLSNGQKLTGSVESLCKNIIEKGTRITTAGLTVQANNFTGLYILNDVPYPGNRVVSVTFDLTNNSFTLTESTLNINRTFTYSGGNWTYVDN